MTSMLLRTARRGLALVGLTVVAIGATSSAAGSFPDPRVDEAPSHGSETAVLAGGCINDLPKITRLKRELPDLCISN